LQRQQTGTPVQSSLNGFSPQSQGNIALERLSLLSRILFAKYSALRSGVSIKTKCDLRRGNRLKIAAKQRSYPLQQRPHLIFVSFQSSFFSAGFQSARPLKHVYNSLSIVISS
jgi:hypothetical protein